MKSKRKTTSVEVSTFEANLACTLVASARIRSAFVTSILLRNDLYCQAPLPPPPCLLGSESQPCSELYWPSLLMHVATTAENLPLSRQQHSGLKCQDGRHSYSCAVGLVSSDVLQYRHPALPLTSASRACFLERRSYRIMSKQSS